MSVTKKQIVEALEDLTQTLFTWNDLPDVRDSSKQQLIDFLLEKQSEKGEALEPEDFDVLQEETVQTLIDAGIPVPKEWKEQLGIEDEEMNEDEEMDEEIEKTVEKEIEEKTEKKRMKKEEKEVSKEKPKKEKVKEEKVEKEESEKKNIEESKKDSARGKNFLGHLLSSGNAELDSLMMEKPFSIDEMVEKGFSKSRVHNHLNHLKREKSELVSVSKTDDGKYKVVKK